MHSSAGRRGKERSSGPVESMSKARDDGEDRDEQARPARAQGEVHAQQARRVRPALVEEPERRDGEAVLAPLAPLARGEDAAVGRAHLGAGERAARTARRTLDPSPSAVEPALQAVDKLL